MMLARLAAVAALVLAAPLSAAPGDWVKALQPATVPAQPGGIPLSPPAPAAPPEGWAGQAPGQRLAYNVGQAELLPLPSSLPKDKTAPAVLLVPGGGFQFLAMDNEGYDVAKRLDTLGVRVFIVKYRTLPIAGGFAGFQKAITATFLNGETPDLNQRMPAAADTAAAIQMVRARAGEWHVDPAKVVALGFSAGAITVLTELLAHPEARPDYAGLIYGPTAGAPVPAKAPPLFAAIAADDRFFKDMDLSLIHGWRQAGSSVELHLYSAGGHGFASHPNGTTSDAWFDQFALWLKAMKVTG